ncbi:MucR family transcriptional regulator [Xenorhabdus bovienii]|uniref:MucR family transcriptional regulator n=1 Tax=Xenorhabdus bovienii TaxID=40576 RepID=UPI0023B2EFE9|nr:MucR family transcriptional regulator [Xenorhabdus bovienii]MDE9484466.1 MucR family transcriptional regulator [Xenorhabdus bovienii]
MSGKRISNREQLGEYLNHEKIECLECGARFSFLGNHVRKSHHMTLVEYREKFNIPATTPLAGLEYRRKHRDKIKQLQADGRLDYSHLPTATANAIGAERTRRRDFDLADQSDRVSDIHKLSPRTKPRK